MFLAWLLWFLVEIPLSCIDSRWWNVAFFATGAIAAAAMVTVLALVARGRDPHLPTGDPMFTADGSTLTIGQNNSLQLAQMTFHAFAAIACLIFGVGVPAGFLSVTLFAGQQYYLPALAVAIGLYSFAVVIVVLVRRSTGRLTLSPHGVVYVSLASRHTASWKTIEKIHVYRRTVRRPYCVIGLDLGDKRAIRIYADYLSLHAPAILWLLQYYKANQVTDANDVLDKLYFEVSTDSGQPGRV